MSSSKSSLDFSITDPQRLGRQIRRQGIGPEEVPARLREAAAVSPEAVYSFSRGLIATETDRGQFLAEADRLFDAGVALDAPARKQMLAGVMDAGGQASKLFLIQRMSGLKRSELRPVMGDFMEAGGRMPDIALWLESAGKVLRKHNIKASDTAGAVVDALGDAGEWLVDTLEDGVDAILEAVDAILDAATDVGAALVDLFEDVVTWTADQMANLLAALIEAGRELVEFVAAVFDWAYDAVTTFVEAAFTAGFRILDLMETVVNESYFALRRIVTGIVRNLGPVSDIMNAVLNLAENAASNLWRSTLLALRFAEATLTDVLDWMADQTAAVFEAVIRAWESIGEALLTLYEWARTAGELVWFMIGEATAHIGNSAYYLYNFMTTSVPDFFFAVTRGLIQGGRAIGELISWGVGQAIEICGEIIRAALDMGVTIGQMLVEIVTDPRNALNTFIQAMFAIGQTLDDLLEAVIIETAEEFLDEVVDALRELGQSVLAILEASFRLKADVINAIIFKFFDTLGTYRRMTDEEIADARLAFGNSLDYDLIFLSNEDPANDIVFGVQDFLTKNPESRAFVTGNLINFDPEDDNFDRPTLIHELVHVWQYKEVGGMYAAEALFAQPDPGSDDPYNYGYFEFAGNNIGSGNGMDANFTASIATPVTPNSLNVFAGDTEGDPLGIDDGAGNIVGPGILSGTIDYVTGALDITFLTPPDAGDDVVVHRKLRIEDRYDGRMHDFFEGNAIGLHADNALINAAGDFEQFNREQQGQIIMHWFTRNHLRIEGTNGNPISYDSTAWDPYQLVVEHA